MATVDEKRKGLVELLGDEELVNDLLKGVSSKEAKLEGEGISFKAKAKAPQADDSPDPEDEDMEEEVPTEDEVEEEDEDMEEEYDEEEDEEEEEAGKEVSSEFLGDVPAAIFYDRLAGALSDVLSPYIAEVKEIRATLTATKEADSRDAEIKSLKEKIAAQAKELDDLRGKAEKESRIPRAARQFIASEADETVVDDERAKELGAPQPDPLAEFSAFALGQQ